MGAILDPALENIFAGYVLGGLLLLTRLSLILAVVPGFTDQSLPARLKATIAILMTVVLDWGMGGIVVPMPTDIVTPLILFGREAIIGAGIGLAVRIIFAAVEGAGAVAGTSMALSLNVLLDPATGEQNLTLGTLLAMVATLAFVALDGHHHVIVSLVAHMEAYPVGASPVAVDVDAIAQAGVRLAETALLLASPVVVVTLLIYVSLALVGRLVPSMNLFGVGLSLIIGAGFLAMSMEGDAIIAAMEQGLEGLPRAAEDLSTGG